MKVTARPIITWLIIIINCLVFMSIEQKMVSPNALDQFLFIQMGALEASKVWSGEIWRLITAIFLHANWMHLLFNAFILYQVGKIVEPLLTWPRFLLIYLLSGAVGFAASLLTYHSLSLGSSGAVFGVVGALVGLLLALPSNFIERRLLKSLMFFIGLNFAFGIFVNRAFSGAGIVDNAAHMGGFFTGLLLGIGFSADVLANFVKEKPLRLPKWLVQFALFASFTLVIGTVTIAIKPTFLPEYYFYVGQEAYLTKQYNEANKMAEHLTSLPSAKGWGKLLSGYVLSAQKDYPSSTVAFKESFNLLTQQHVPLEKILFSFSHQLPKQEALFWDERSSAALCHLAIDSHDAKDPFILNDCAWLLLMAKDAKVQNKGKALTWAKAAHSYTSTPKAEILHTLAEAYAQNNNISDAQSTIEQALLLGPNSSLSSEKQRYERLAKKGTKVS